MKTITENNIKERIGIHKVALTFLMQYGWLEREQPVSDVGIDMQIEIVEDGKPTGLLYGLQVKSGNSYIKEKESDQNIIYYLQNKRHVDYWLDHSLPVLLVLCDLENDAMYWNLINRESLSKTPKGWTIKIPKENRLGNETSKEKIQGYYFNNENFTIMKSAIDTSHALSRRIAMKIILKKETPKSIIEKQIPQLIEGLKISDYYRSEIVEKHYKDKPADSVWVWIYKNIEQYKNGFPFCTAYWNHPESKSPTVLNPDDKEIQDGIFINYSDLGLNDNYVRERLTKGKYLKIVDNFLLKSNQIFNEINTLFSRYKTEENISIFRSETLKYKKEFQELLSTEYYQNLPPLECSDLSQTINNLNDTIDNIFVILEDTRRTNKNTIDCINMYFKNYYKTLNAARYEREKVI